MLIVEVILTFSVSVHSPSRSYWVVEESLKPNTLVNLAANQVSFHAPDVLLCRSRRIAVVSNVIYKLVNSNDSFLVHLLWPNDLHAFANLKFTLYFRNHYEFGSNECCRRRFTQHGPHNCYGKLSNNYFDEELQRNNIYVLRGHNLDLHDRTSSLDYLKV